MEPVTLLPPVVALAVAAYWALLLRRYPNAWPRSFELRPFPRLPRTRRTWRIVALLGVAAGLATAAFTLMLALQGS